MIYITGLRKSIVVVVLFAINLLFACSNQVQKSSGIDVTEVLEATKTTEMTETSKSAREIKKISVEFVASTHDIDFDIEGYKYFMHIDTYSYYDEKEGVWKNDNTAKIIDSLKKFLLIGRSFGDKELGTINIENYIKRIEDKILSSNYLDIVDIDLSKEPFYSEDLNVIEDADKKIIEPYLILDFDKEKKKIASVWLRGYLLTK